MPTWDLSLELDAEEGVGRAQMTATCVLHDIKGSHKYKNSRTGSGYIVRPKMHGPEEVSRPPPVCTEVPRS